MQRRAQQLAAALCAAVLFCAAAAAQPRWGEPEIRASRIVHPASGTLPDAPAFTADPLNLFVVVEAGDHHVTILDGDRLEPMHRFSTRPSLQGDPHFSPDGRHAFFASRDGWISKFDLWQLRIVAEVRAGFETRGVALSADGRFLAVGNVAPPALVVLDPDLLPVRILAAADSANRRSSPVTAVRTAAARRSFVAALPDLKEIWEVSYDRAAPEIAAGLVHDYKLREGSFISGFLNPRRSPLEEPIEDLEMQPDGRQVVGVTRDRGKGHLIHLDVRRRIATVERDSVEAVGGQNPGLVARLQAASGGALSGIAFDRHGRYALATEKGAQNRLIVYDTSTLREVKRLSMQEPMGKYNVFNEINRHQGSSH